MNKKNSVASDVSLEILSERGSIPVATENSRCERVCPESLGLGRLNSWAMASGTAGVADSDIGVVPAKNSTMVREEPALTCRRVLHQFAAFTAHSARETVASSPATSPALALCDRGSRLA